MDKYINKYNLIKILETYKSYLVKKAQNKINFFLPKIARKRAKLLLFGVKKKINKRRFTKLQFIANKRFLFNNLQGCYNKNILKNYKMEKLSTRQNKIRQIVNIKITPNNTIIALTKKNGNLLYSFSVGRLGLHSSKKNYKLIHQLVLTEMLNRLKKERKKKYIQFKFSVPKNLRRRLLKRFRFHFKNKNIFESLRKLPFNGCRPPKLRRKKRKGLRILKPKI